MRSPIWIIERTDYLEGPFPVHIIFLSFQKSLFFFLSFFVGWIPFSLKGLVTGIGIFLPFYAIIWIIFYLYFRYQVKILNDELDKRGN
ncbi:DUF3021 family protein [Peribacillus sp. FSL K6-1552]|uniref:DUF3021 family protein n=1 Tax=Peribacillus sp. FSL K6-1552 TaxID=2954514 RepID=UPI004046CE8F